MIRDELYEQTFALKKANPWEAFGEKQVFAVRTAKQMCIAEVTGRIITDNPGMCVYPGEESMVRFRRMAQAVNFTQQEQVAVVLSQNVLQLTFVNREETTKREADEIRTYAKALGISLRGKKAWPLFSHIHPYQPATDIVEEEAEILKEAIQAACWVKEHYGTAIQQIPEIGADTAVIPLLEKQDSGYSVGELKLDELPPFEYPVGRNHNDLYKARVRKMKKQGKWYCEVQVHTVPLPAESVEGLYYPWNLATYSLDREKPIQVQMVRDYENRTEVMLDKLMEAIFREKICPVSIAVSDDRTEALLKDWCRETGIRLSGEERPEGLEESDFGMADDDDETEPENMPRQGTDIVDYLLTMIDFLPDQFWLDNPGELIEARRNLAKIADQPMLTPEQRRGVKTAMEKTDRLLKKAGTGKPKKKVKTKKGTDEKTLIISVSLDTGCYRHIRISNQSLLSALSEAILEAFAFFDDHAHAFFMDNRAFSGNDCYYVSGIDSYYPTTDETTIAESGLQAGQKFKYVFDFGEEWIFQCRVLKELDEKTAHPEVIRSKGTAPEQYPDWDMDWDEDDDWDEDE